ncbi:MAG: hypothetical protein GY771_17000 [bacterium]|nr:hypothetical protein [bacterium]
MTTTYQPYLSRIIVDSLKADPTRWLLKARSPLVKWATYTHLLEWPDDHPEVRKNHALIHEDDDFARITGAQRDDGTWLKVGRFPDNGLYGAYYMGTVWQLPLLADIQINAASVWAVRAFAAISTTVTSDGFFDLTGKGLPLTRVNAIVCGAFLDMGFPRTDVKEALAWLGGRQREDGGWADFFELNAPDAPSSIKTTAAVLYALRSKDVSPDNPLEATGVKGSEYLSANLFGDYLERFPRSAKAWSKLSWPQYNYDILTIGRALQMSGLANKELAKVTKAIINEQTHRGFWRQQINIIAPTHISPVATGRASRWLTFKAAQYIKTLHDPLTEKP